MKIKLLEDGPCFSRGFTSNFTNFTMIHRGHKYFRSRSFKGVLQKMNCHEYFIRRVTTQKKRRKLIFHGHIWGVSIKKPTP